MDNAKGAFLMNTKQSEFRTLEEIHYDTRGPKRWIFSHVMKYPFLPILALLFSLGNNIGFSSLQYIIGQGFDVIRIPGWQTIDLFNVALLMALAALLQGLAGIGRNMSFEFLAQKIERDARSELYTSLLGKSQTFHSKQKIGNIMAKATNDVHFLNLMFSPGLMLIMDSMLTLIVPLIFIVQINPKLLLVPLIFIFFLLLTIRFYNRKLNPATDEQREQFGIMNAGLADALEGIEAVKANSGEIRELKAFAHNANKLRDLYIRIASIQARYWPLLVFAISLGAGFFHALLLWKEGSITLGNVISYMMLFNAFHFATFISLFSFNLFQMGVSSASRVLETINEKTDLDENTQGHSGKIEGKVEFKKVSFSFGENKILSDISFTIQKGETVAIVGRTGSGKTSIARLVNRIFDADSGGIYIDDINVKDWHLESLRSQIASIEQDIFLFSRSIKDNIKFGKEEASNEEITTAAKEAQAHDFIQSFEKAYETEVGERGVTLSGGQKQRIAIARAFLVNPQILILDDSTSAIDSKTEDEIQKAMQRASKGRTTFLITHRLSQIRHADKILVLDRGKVAAFGTHEDLILKNEDYRHLFARI